jgi:hypothetical protein
MTAAENKFLKKAVKQGLRMHHLFLAEPLLARTGKGRLKSEGVTTLQRIKASLKKSKSKAAMAGPVLERTDTGSAVMVAIAAEANGKI